MNAYSGDDINAQGQSGNYLSSIRAVCSTFNDPSQDDSVSSVENATNQFLDYHSQQSSSLAINVEGLTNNTASNNNLDQTFYVNSQSQNSASSSVYQTNYQTQYSITNLNTLPSKSGDQSHNKEELLTLLKGWNLESIFEHLLTEHVFINVLKVLKRHQIDKLLKEFNMGTQILFEHCLEEWRHSIGLPLDTPYDPRYQNLKSPEPNIPSPQSSYTALGSISLNSSRLTTPYSRPSTPDQGNSIRLVNILNESSRGAMLMECYNRFSKFTDEQRGLLINAIAQAFEEKRIQMTLATSYRIEKEILEIFPTEKLEFYRTSKRGKLYNKCCNRKSSFKSAVAHHLLSRTDDNDQTTNQKGKSWQNKYPVPEEDAEDIYRSLKFDNLSSEVFDSTWKACKQYRFNDLKMLKSTTDIFAKWPFYKFPSGFRLIDMDFTAAFENADGLLKNWPTYCNTILSFLNDENHVKEKGIRIILAKVTNENLSENGHDAAIMWALHGYFVPTNKLVKKDDTLGKKVTTKFTIKDSQDSFLYVGKCAQELEDHLEFLKNQKQAIQPFILAVGQDIFSIKEIFVYFDGIRFTFSHFSRAVDICYKIFYVFNLDFPKKAQMFWSFIQTFFYKNNTEKSFSKVHILTQFLLENQEN